MLRASADRHAAVSLPVGFGNDYMVEHSLGAYGALLLGYWPG